MIIYLLKKVINNQRKTKKIMEEIMAAIENLEANDVSLGKKLDQAITFLTSNPNNDARVQAVADSLKAKENKIDAVLASAGAGQ